MDIRNILGFISGISSKPTVNPDGVTRRRFLQQSTTAATTGLVTQNLFGLTPGVALSQTRPPVQTIKDEDINSIANTLDRRSRLFTETKLYGELQKLEVPISKTGFPEWNQESLANLIKIAEANSSDIGAGSGLNLSKIGINDQAQILKFTHAISFGEGSPKELKGSTFLIPDPATLRFDRADNKTILYDKAAARVYAFRYADKDIINESLHVRMNNSTVFELMGGAKIQNGRVVNGIAELDVGFIGGNPKTIYEINIDPKAPKSIVANPVITNGTSSIIKITVPASAVQIYIPETK